MTPSACNPNSGLIANVDKQTQSSGPEHTNFVARSVAPQESDRYGNDNEPVPPVEDAAAERATEDLEASHQTPSGTAYSVFTDRQRRLIIIVVACAGFFSPLSANIYFPALNALSRDLKASNELINLTLTSYMIFQGLAPTIFGDLADMTGRRPVYILGFVIYIGSGLHRPALWFLTDASARCKYRACLAE